MDEKRKVIYTVDLVNNRGGVWENRKSARVIKPQPVASIDGMLAKNVPEWYYPFEFVKFCQYGKPKDTLPPEDKIFRALEVAAYFSAGVQRPFNLEVEG